MTRPDHPAFTEEAIEGLVTELPLEHQLDEAVTPEVMLLGYTLPDDMLVQAEPDSNWLTLFWRATSNVDHDYVVAVQLLAQQNEEVAYWLGRPVLSGYATDQWQAGEIVRDPWLLDLPPDVSPGNYTLQLVLFDAGTEAEAGRTTLGGVSLVERRRQFDIPTMQNALNKWLNDQVTLLGYDLSTEPLTGGGRLRVILYWQARAPLESSYSVFVHLLDSSGSIVAQHDGVPVNGSVPTHNWATDEVITDQHLVEFPSLSGGEYRLVVGLYNSTTGERLAAASGDTSILLRTLSLD